MILKMGELLYGHYLVFTDEAIRILILDVKNSHSVIYLVPFLSRNRYGDVE